MRTGFGFRWLQTRELAVRDPNLPYRASWIELFYDLAFVVALGSTTHLLVDAEIADGLFRFVVVFALLVWSWTSFTFFISIFQRAERLHLLALIQIALVLFLSTLRDVFDSEYMIFALGYAALRGMTAVMYIFAWVILRESRTITGPLVLGFSVSLLPLFGGFYYTDPETREWLLCATAVMQITGAGFAFTRAKNIGFNNTHAPERLGLFISLAFGECLLAISRVGQQSLGFHESVFLPGFLTLFVVFAYWRLYFGLLSSSRFDGLRPRAMGWIMLHMPLALSIVVMAAGIERNLASIRAETETVASVRMMVAWGGGLVTIVLLSLFWHPERWEGRDYLWRAIAFVTGCIGVATPFFFQTIDPIRAVYLMAGMSLILLTINPTVGPWRDED